MVILLGGTGCGSVLHVKEHQFTPTKDVDLAGVPFYIKKGRCKQQTIKLEPKYTLTLVKRTKVVLQGLSSQEMQQLQAFEQLLDKSSPTGFRCMQSTESSTLECTSESLPESVILDECQFRNKSVSELRAYLDGKDVAGDDKVVLKLWDNVKHVAANPGECPERILTASNSTKIEPYIDYASPHYINANYPWIGTASANFTLSADQTLTNATATIDSKTVETLLGFLPISPALSKVLKLPAAPAESGELAKRAKATTITTYTLVQEPTIRKYTLVKYTIANPNEKLTCDPAVPLQQANIDKLDEYSVEDLKPGQPPPKPKENAIEFSGEIKLPEKKPDDAPPK
ncbi:hypothetical protein L0156_11795 [bacterium]|nr:hypothetical protein [bacterium]